VINFGVFCSDQHQNVAEQIEARTFVYDLFLHAIVHPLQVGRKERIGRSAALDLLHQRRTGIIASDNLDAGLLRESRIDVVERRLNAEHARRVSMADYDV
jgi:hypothetical protein